MNRTLLSRTAPALLLLLGAAPALAQTTIFTDNFQSGNVQSQWSSNSTINTANESTLSWYSGRYSGQTIHLHLPGAPAAGAGHQNQYTLRFDFLALDSWDGDDTVYGPDTFGISANGVAIFNETFSNWGNNQSFRAPDVGPTMLGGDSRYPDSIYRSIAVPFTVGNGQAIDLAFYSTANQGMNDESWGIDNIKIWYSVVPAPSALAVPAFAGLTGLLRAGRRRG